jgi:DNA-binding transcriptional MocR family regulator
VSFERAQNSFPFSALEALLRYQSHGGRPHERASVALHLEQRGLTVPADQVLIVSGAQHGLAVAALAMLKPGDVVAVDALTYPGFKVLTQVRRLELVPLPAAADGPDLGALTRLCATRRVRAIYTMPTLHNPLATLAPESTIYVSGLSKNVATGLRFGFIVAPKRFIEHPGVGHRDRDRMAQ